MREPIDGLRAANRTRTYIARILRRTLDRHRRPQRVRQIDAAAYARRVARTARRSDFAARSTPRGVAAARACTPSRLACPDARRHGTDGIRGGRPRSVRARWMAGTSAGGG